MEIKDYKDEFKKKIQELENQIKEIKINKKNEESKEDKD